MARILITLTSTQKRKLYSNVTPTEKMSSECKASRYTVAKILQLADPQIISTVSRLAQCDIHIAHLIRDPRPSILSRMASHNTHHI